MSYSKFKKTQKEFKEIFSAKSKISKVRDFENKNLNLILTSENIVGTLKPILEDMLNKEVDDIKVALIPNAEVEAAKIKNTFEYLEQFTTINNMYLKMLDLSRWPKEVILQSLENCDVISFGGGSVSRLMKTIDKLGIRNELIHLIENGKPFIGFSAGAMSLSKTVHFAKNYIGEPDPALNEVKPLGIVNFEVYPHFEDVVLPSIKNMLPEDGSIEAYALKSTEAMIVTKGELLQAGNPAKV